MYPIHFSDHSRHVLITGATGFIGQQLVKALLTDGHRVSILTRHPKQAASLFDGHVSCIRDMHDLAATERIDVIVNLAGARILGWRWTHARKETLRKSRIGLTQTVIDWIAQAEHKPTLMFSASAIGYYGIQRHGDDTLLNEESPPSPIFMSQLCQEWEATARQAEKFGVRVIRTRFGLVLGQQGALPMMMLPIKLGFGGPLGDGKQWMSWIHVHDLLRGFAHLWTLHEGQEHHSTNDVFNFTAPEAVQQRQFNQIAADVLHRPNWLPMPAILMRLPLGEQADLLLEGQRVSSEKLNQVGFKFDYPNLRSALQDLA